MWGPCSEAQANARWKPVGDSGSCLHTNLDYVKVPKTGSSTVGGVMRRIAARHGLYGVEMTTEALIDSSKQSAINPLSQW